MVSALKFLLITNLLFSSYTEINCSKDCDAFITTQNSEKKFAVATFLIRARPNENHVSVELSIDPNDFESGNEPGHISLFESNSKTVRNMLSGSPVKFQIKYQKKVNKIESISLNGKHNCVNNLMRKSSATSTIKMHFTLTLPRNSVQLMTSTEILYVPKKSSKPELTFSDTTATTISSVPTKPDFTNFDQTTTISSVPSRHNVSEFSEESKWLNTFKFNQECGKKELVIVETIINGIEIQPNEFPWLVALFSGRRKYFCGGTLVSDQHVISAAHCTINKTVVNMELGKHRLDIVDEPGVYFIQSKQIINHPEYIPKTGHADISLIITSRKITFSDKIKPICIWPFRSHDVGQIGTVAGWGVDLSGYGTNTPMAAEVDIVSNADCLNAHYLFRNITSETTFCAGGKNKGPCSGDSGSGFVIERQGRWYLKGIISVSLSKRITSCEVNRYAVYCDVGKYLGWLGKYMNY